MSKSNLVIVESPAKAKTISGYLGSEFEVLSSYGHIRDLPSKGLAIDIKNNFKPEYEISPDKSKVVSALRKAAKGAKTVWLATDEDREGEAIAWHLSAALNLKAEQTKRIVFHEITKDAIQAAVKNPRKIDIHLVDAQQGRRVLDRLVGYELSPVLWRKIRPGLSAGRVQSVAVRLIVEREREIREFEAGSQFVITGIFATKNKHQLPVEAIDKFAAESNAHEYLKLSTKANFTVGQIKKSPGTRRPSPPFTTSTLQQEASRGIGMGVRSTMRHAQGLYESGHITYMRTDSLNVSEQSITAAQKWISGEFGAEYSNPTRYKAKTKGAQEAHEAIRPTRVDVEVAGKDESQKKIYRLIRRRFLASQMAPAKIEKTEVLIDNSAHKVGLKAVGEMLVFPGWLKMGRSKDDIILPEVVEGDNLGMVELKARQTYEKPHGRYTESALVRKLEELGIGRPSTYAPTISTIETRGYVQRGESEGEDRAVIILTAKNGKIEKVEETEHYGADRGKLVPTPSGEQVTDFLREHFKDIMDYDFTAEVESNLDKVEDGDKKWQTVVGDFYKGLHKQVDVAAKVKKSEAAQARLVGKDPKSGKPIYARYGRFGPMLQRGESGEKSKDEEKPDFAPLPPGERIETIELKAALHALSLPRTLGTDATGDEISVHIGRFGPYIKVGEKNVSLGDDHDPYTVDLETAKNVITAGKRKDTMKYIQKFEAEGINVLKGRYGPYATDGKVNASIPKDQDPKTIKLESIQQLLKDAPAKKGRFGRKKTN